MKRFILFVAIFYIFSAIPAFSQENLQSVLSKGPFSESEKSEIISRFNSIEKDGIPSRLILPRLEEGIAKRIPFQKIMSVLENEFMGLRQARMLLVQADPAFPFLAEEAVWMHVALLYAKKVPESSMRMMAGAAASRWKDFRPATELYFSLVQWGIGESSAAGLATRVLLSRIPGADFSGILQLFIRGRSMYISPDKIEARIFSEIDSVSSVEALEKRILY